MLTQVPGNQSTVGTLSVKFPFHLCTNEGVTWQDVRSFFSLASVNNLCDAFTPILKLSHEYQNKGKGGRYGTTRDTTT